MQRLMNAFGFFLAAAAVFIAPVLARGAAPEPAPVQTADPHRTDVGFFDIHVCHWPDRPDFYFTLFSTAHFDSVAAVEVFYPDGAPLGTLDLGRYRLIQAKGKPEERTFVTFFDLPAGAPEGWYSARIRTKNGKVHLAKDYVVPKPLSFATGFSPAPDAKDIPMPTELRWNPVPGANYYRVFVKDLWNPSPMLLETKPIRETRLALPPSLLQKGGTYRWRVQARAADNDPALGEFGFGSLSPEIEFSVADE